MQLKFLLYICLLILAGSLRAQDSTKIIRIKGDIKVRIGLEEEWQKGQIGMILRDLDTIFSGENSQVILLNHEGQKFSLEANSIIDISDLRKIQERELFLFLMSQKVDNIESPDKDTKIRIGNVSVVHGSSQEQLSASAAQLDAPDWYTLEINGANALYDHAYYPNAIIKLTRVKNRFGEKKDMGMADFYIARSFAAMDNDGQAIDSYRSALHIYSQNTKDARTDPDWVLEARKSLARLQKN